MFWEKIMFIFLVYKESCRYWEGGIFLVCGERMVELKIYSFFLIKLFVNDDSDKSFFLLV